MMSGYYVTESPEEVEAETEFWWYYGKSGHYRLVGMNDARNNRAHTPVPTEDADYQRYYDEGYADGSYWNPHLTRNTM